MKRTISFAAAATLALAGAVLAGSNSAQADPYGCTIGHPTSSTSSAKCVNGTGEYRAYTRCDASFAFDYDAEGPWVRIGQTSVAKCSQVFHDRAFNSTVQVR